MIREPLSPAVSWVIAAASIVVMVVAYTALSVRQHRINPDDKSLPGWSKLYEGAKSVVTPHHRSKEIWLYEDSKATLTRLFQGLGIGVAGALALGFLMGCWAPAEAFFSPPLTIAAKLNPIAMLAVFLAMFGTGETMFIAMITFGILPALAITTHLAIKFDVPEELIHKSYTLGASHFEIIGLVVFRQVLPKVLEGVRAQIGPALVYLVAAEMVFGDSGFGYRIRLQSRLLDMKVVYPYIAVLALFGYGLDLALRMAMNWFCPWYVKYDSEDSAGVVQGLLHLVGLGSKEAS